MKDVRTANILGSSCYCFSQEKGIDIFFIKIDIHRMMWRTRIKYIIDSTNGSFFMQ
jgi:hypothetical protein